jgi:hypothetical protein
MAKVEPATDVLSDFQRSNRWIIENYGNLKKQYNNQWIATSNKAVINHDPDLKKLVKRLKTQHSKVYSQITSEELDLSNKRDLF